MRTATVTAVAAAAVEATAEPEGDVQVEVAPEVVPALDLERVKDMWPAVAEAVREQNAMVAALVGEAVPSALEDQRLTISFPADAGFHKKKAEANRELVLGALRSLTGTALARGLRAQRDGGGPGHADAWRGGAARAAQAGLRGRGGLRGRRTPTGSRGV